MEQLDIVDETGKVLYSALKDEAHAKGLLHKTVIGLLFNSKQAVMLIKPPHHKQDAGQYVCPGGHVTSGVSEMDALKREVEEEIVIKNFTSKCVGQARFDRHVLGRHENHLFVLYEIYSDETPIAGSELSSMHWFTKAELTELIQEQPREFGDAFYFIANNFYPQGI